MEDTWTTTHDNTHIHTHTHLCSQKRFSRENHYISGLGSPTVQQRFRLLLYSINTFIIRLIDNHQSKLISERVSDDCANRRFNIN